MLALFITLSVFLKYLVNAGQGVLTSICVEEVGERQKDQNVLRTTLSSQVLSKRFCIVNQVHPSMTKGFILLLYVVFIPKLLHWISEEYVVPDIPHIQCIFYFFVVTKIGSFMPLMISSWIGIISSSTKIYLPFF